MARRWVHTGVVVFLGMLLLGVPPTAGASHIASRFNGPALPDPTWDTTVTPQIGSGKVTYQIESTDGDHWGFTWSIGAIAAVALDEIVPARRFDRSANGFVVYDRFNAGDKMEVWVTDGVMNTKIAGGTTSACYPRVYGDTVVWQDDRNGSWDIYAANLDPATHAPLGTSRICGAKGTQSRPDVGDGWVVWQDKRSGQFDIWGKDLASGGPLPLCRHSGSQEAPRTDGQWVVWVDWRNVGWGADVYGKRMGLSARPICHAKKNQKEPDVSSGFVVWTDWRLVTSGGDDLVNTGIRGYDIPSKAGFVISSAAGTEWSPDMDGAQVVYTECSDTHMGSPWYGVIRGANLVH
jgi:beta propeller repeat protein